MFRSPRNRDLVFGFAALAVVSASLLAQGTFTFTHFKRYPAEGQWSSTMQAFRDGKPLGAPQTSTTCAGPLSAEQASRAQRLGNAAAASCKMTVLKDEERTAEYEQVCNFGPQRQVNSIKLEAVDDRTMKEEIRVSMNGQEMSVTRGTTRFLGACPAGTPKPSEMPSVMKMSKEDCAQIPEMRQQTQEALKSCSQLPGAYQADCVTRVQGSLKAVDIMAESCK